VSEGIFKKGRKMSNSDRKQCVRCNATEGEYQPDYGWHLCGTCYEEEKQNEEEFAEEE